MNSFRSLFAVTLLLGRVCAATTDLAPEDERIIASLPAVPAGLNRSESLEIKPSMTVSTLHTYTVSAPELTASEWIIFTPRPPALTSQRILRAETSPPGESVTDLSPLRQPLIRARLAANRPAETKSFSLKTRIDAELFSRRLIQRIGGGPDRKHQDALADDERRLFLRRTPQFDYASPRLLEWAETNRLRRQEDEGEVAFARRAFLTIARGFSYEYLGKQDRSAPYVCSAGKSDCGGLAVLFATVLRSQGIPARTLAGRWAISAKRDEKIGKIDYYQEHVKAEFFAQGVGWVPADLSSAILHDKTPAKLEYFGNDRGDFLTLHFDNDLLLDTRQFGVRPMPLLQRPSYWVKGNGRLDNAVAGEAWTVSRGQVR